MGLAPQPDIDTQYSTPRKRCSTRRGATIDSSSHSCVMHSTLLAPQPTHQERQITDGQYNRECHRGEDLCGKQIPAEQANDEATCASCNHEVLGYDAL